MMTINYQQVREQIQQLAENAPLRAQQLAELRAQAEALLHGHALDLERLVQKVGTIVHSYDPNLRCARPVPDSDGAYGRLNAHFRLPPTPQQATVLAADGSQIIPDRHAAVYFGLINVGAIQMVSGSSARPQTTTTSRLYYDEELYELNEATLALQRDLYERAILAELSKQAQAPVISFTDGPMELWGAKDSSSGDEFQKSLHAYLQVLERLQASNVITAGYVDRPAANLVVRLLEIVLLPQDRLEQVKDYYPLRGVQDIDLFRELLAPGERSGIFAIQSRSAQNYRQGLALHFFYLNVGREGHPWPARVEIPAWVAGNSDMLDYLHATLVDQCRIMGTRAYPYLLHRAHEVAVVTLEEKQQVTQMIAMELQRRGLALGESSHKQSAKELGGRSRYER
jgi:hypothetical protein